MLERSKHHRKLMRDNVLLQILNNEPSSTATIPVKLIQLGNSRLGFFSSNLRPIDRSANNVQTSFAFAQLTCLMILSFRGRQCKNRDDILYKMLASYTLMHLSTLFTGWLLAQKNRRIKRQHRSATCHPREGGEPSLMWYRGGIENGSPPSRG